MIKVLIVEDDPMVAQLNKKYVETVEGFKVVNIVTDGEEAMKYLKSNSVDLMILDVYMPRLDGLKLLDEMRKNSITTDVILVTAAKESASINEALMLGAVDYLIKPFEYERLKKSLINYLIRYELLQAKDTFRQEDIDKLTSRGTGNTNYLQKGLNRRTLRRISDFMDKNGSHPVTAEEVGEQIGMSRVTVKRYLDYLVSTGQVIMEIEYGSVGRPSYQYMASKYNTK